MTEIFAFLLLTWNTSLLGPEAQVDCVRVGQTFRINFDPT